MGLGVVVCSPSKDTSMQVHVHSVCRNVRARDKRRGDSHVWTNQQRQRQGQRLSHVPCLGPSPVKLCHEPCLWNGRHWQLHPRSVPQTSQHLVTAQWL